MECCNFATLKAEGEKEQEEEEEESRLRVSSLCSHRPWPEFLIRTKKWDFFSDFSRWAEHCFAFSLSSSFYDGAM